jgi:hypothetical protein
MDNQEITEAISRRRLALGNAKADAVVMAAFAPYGFDEAKLDEGLQLLNELESAAQAQKVEYGEQLQATETFYDTWKTTQKKYNIAVAIARIEFDEDAAAQTALQLGGRRKRAVAGWVSQATAFYQGLLDNAAWLAKMAGYDDARVQAELTLVSQLGELDRQQEKETGESRAATKARDDKYDVCNGWWSRYLAYAGAALVDEPVKLKLVTEGEI